MTMIVDLAEAASKTTPKLERTRPFTKIDVHDLFYLPQLSTCVMSSDNARSDLPDRLFFAVVPDAETAASIHRLAGALKHARKFEGDLIGLARLHVTLFFLGAWDALPDRIVAMVCKAAAEIASSPFEVSFDRSSSFNARPANYPFVLLGGDGLIRLKAFHRMLGAAMMRNGLRQWVDIDFNPHVTLLYSERSAEEQPIEPIVWTISEFVLIHSLYSQSKHVHLARWPLHARQMATVL